MTPLTIRGVPCGDGVAVYLAFEIGPTLTSLETALQLTGVAARAKADAIKVQILDPDTLVGDPALTVAYRDHVGETVTELMLDVLRRRVLPDAEWAHLAFAAHRAGLGVIATVDSPRTLEVALRAGADALKVCSGDVADPAWIRMVAATAPRLPLMLDTGNATLGEIEAAVDAAHAAGNPSLVIHHVPSGYPARLGSINLRVIPTLRQMFPTSVIAFSDHTPGHDMDVAAVALGARMIEKTLTLDRCTRGPEHMFSVEPEEAGAFVRVIRDVETALGSPRRILTDAEKRGKVGARRSAFAALDLLCGHEITEDDVIWRRPGDGIAPAEAPYLIGREVQRVVPAGQRIRWGDVR